MIRLPVPALLAMTLLTGCAVSSTPLQRSDIAHSALKSRPGQSDTLRCGFRAEVVDARTTGNEAGHIGDTAFVLSDAAALVRDRLSVAGFGSDAESGATPVSIEINQLYLAQNQGNKVPVVVYRASIDGNPPWILRSREISVNWWGSRDEGLRALARALDDVDAQLVARLNEHCERGPSRSP